MATPLEDKLAAAREAQVNLWRRRRRRAFWMVVFWTTLTVVASVVLSTFGVKLELFGIIVLTLILSAVGLLADALFGWRGANIDAYVEVDRTAPAARRIKKV